MNFTTIDPADLNSPRRELSNGGLGIVVALLVRWQNDFLSAHIGYPIQLRRYVAILAKLQSLTLRNCLV